MALKSLLDTAAVLDLCGGEVVLPSQSPALGEARKAEDLSTHLRRHTAALRSKIVAAGAEVGTFKLLELLKGAGSQQGGELAAFDTLPRSSPTLATLTETLALGVGLLSRWAREASDPRLDVVVDAFTECLKWTQSLPLPRFSDELPGLIDVSAVTGTRRREKALQDQFFKFLNDLTGRIRALPAGGFLVLPAGWLRSHVSQKDIAADDSGHCLLLVLLRAASKNEFTLAVVNTGDGLQYHPVRASGAAPRPDLPLRQVPMILSNIPANRVTTSTFWYMVYRPLVYPAQSNGSDIFYGSLLPFLNQQPLSENFGAEPEGASEFLQVPISGDGSFAICLQRAVRYCLLAAGMADDQAAWSSVRLRQGLVSALADALVAPGTPQPSVSELALVRVAMRSLAHTAAEYVDQYESASMQPGLEEVKKLLLGIEANLWEHEHSQHDIHSVQPPICPAEVVCGSAEGLATHFGHFDRILQEDVEHLKGEVELPHILITVPISMMPTAVRDPFEASECCRLAANLLTLLTNQQDRIAQSAPARFALITHLMTQLLPMPLPVDHREKKARCFWMQDMRYETKADLMRHIYLIARHFSAVCFTLRANRETDGARVVVAAGLAAVMDALMRRSLGGPLNGSLLSLHYSGDADGPTAPFGLDPGVFQGASDNLMLIAPEYQSLRSLTLDYFDSIRRNLDDDHIIFQFDQSMQCCEGDRKFIEQVGLSLGVDAARRDAPLLITGQRPDLSELFLELSWFRDVVFLWKMLLLPVEAGPQMRSWRATDSILQWQWEKEAFIVRGFGDTVLTPHIRRSSTSSSFHDMMTWFGRYKSQDKAISGASPSVLAKSDVRSEDDVLFLPNMPSFNGTLRPGDSELLLTYLTAPYIRVPLLLGFFTNRDRISLLREPQLQAVLDAALFEPGPWQSRHDEAQGPPKMIPAPDRRHLGTPTGLLFNELLKSPKVVLDAVSSMLHVAVEKDTGQPGSANEGLILYLIRLAVRVESYLAFLIRHARTGAYLERSGASYEAKVRGLADLHDKAMLEKLESAQARLRRELQGDVFRMMLRWAQWATKKREAFLHVACRAHAHLALLYRNMEPANFGVRDVAVFLSSQIFLNANHRWFKPKRSDQDVSEDSLGVCEVELYDMFQAKRSHLTNWLREKAALANQVFDMVERMVTLKGGLDANLGGESEHNARQWIEIPNNPGNFVPQSRGTTNEWLNARFGESFHPWLLRTTQGPPESNCQISINLGQYGSKRDGLELLPEWALESDDYLDAYGQTEAHCSDKEVASNRITKELAGHSHILQYWTQDGRGPREDPHTALWLESPPYNPHTSPAKGAWLREVFEPVRATLTQLQAVTWHTAKDIPDTPDAEVWMVGIHTTKANAAGQGEVVVEQLKEVCIRRAPPVVELYNVTGYGRQFYRTLIFSSDTTWSFHAPSAEMVLSHRNSYWTFAAGKADAAIAPTTSVLVSRKLTDKFGQQMYFPTRFLKGLLPDALLERYKFWRSKANGVQFLIGEEREACDAPTRLRVQMEIRSTTIVVASVQRKMLKIPDDPVKQKQPTALWDEHDAEESELLVNMQHGAPTLTHLLARLDNLSYILTWTDSKGSAGVTRVELPRLRLSFTRSGKCLNCDQHNGYHLMDHKCSESVERLVAQWGGGTVLLEDDAGELAVIVSAVSEPMRPSVGLAGCTLPEQLVFRRGEATWMSNLTEGAHHYFYPIHVSGTFTFVPTFSASLYLLLCRFLTWHFKDIVGVAGTVSEISTQEEKQLWDRLNLLEADNHADAVACRLRLILATVPYGTVAATMRGDTSRLLLEYMRKRILVSADCALSLSQELILLELPGVQWHVQKEPELLSRREVLRRLVPHSAPPGERQERVTLHLGQHYLDAGFDRVVDKTFTQDAGFFERISTTFQDVAYTRPENTRMRGLAAFEYLESMFSDYGASSLSASFPLLYELFTGTIILQVVDGDENNVLASALLRVVARSGSKGAGHSILRTLELNPEACAGMPKWGSNELKWTFSIGSFKFDRDSTSKLLEAAGDKLKSIQRSVRWPRNFSPPTPPVTSAVIDAVHGKHLRYWSAPLTNDVMCECRVFSAAQGEEFGGMPLEKAVKKYVQFEKESMAMPPGAAAVGKFLEHMKGETLKMTGLSKSTFERLLQGLQSVSQSSPDRPSLGLMQKLEKKVGTLSKDLQTQQELDVKFVEQSIAAAVHTANKGSVGNWMRRKGGHLPQIEFSPLVAVLMAQEQRAAEVLQKVNPTLTKEDLESLFDDIAAVLCRTVRIGQVSRVQRAVQELQAEQRAGSSELAVSLKSQAVAAQLSAARYFTRVLGESDARQKKSFFSRSPKIIQYDPRMLVFEFLFNIMLREPQVRLLDTFTGYAKAGQSVCHQMIMGEGKTTVIAPLLALLLADGKTLVCACMPSALLDMSRAVMSERFSSPILQRPVLTLVFQRHMPVRPALRSKLDAARQGRAVVVAAPASVKSVLLKQIELFQELHEACSSRLRSTATATPAPEAAEARGGWGWLQLPKWLGGSGSSASPYNGRLSPEDEAARVEEVLACNDILRMFHKGVMLLDEVDLLLDPLKSELNWPLGKRVPLDLTEAREGPKAKQQHGFRYMLPFHLLDAFFVSMGARETVDYSEWHDAQVILGALAQKVNMGRRQLKLQSTPHLVILSKEFYIKELLPHLIDWAALFLEVHLEGALGDSDLKPFLRYPNKADDRVKQKLRAAPERVLKVLNLSVKWLHCHLPHILSKVHRVSYGLLTGLDLKKAISEKGTPISRKLLAVPFVGKDTPSTSSEFSHPDVAIGFTIMAYRLDGMREGDVNLLLKVLLDEMKLETTAKYHHRAACRSYVSMVTRAGGMVRGFTEDCRWIADLKEDEQKRRLEHLAMGDADAEQTDDSGQHLWPLELLDLADPEQMRAICKILQKSSLAIRHLLDRVVFLPNTGTLDNNESQLSVSGQELAGPQLFGQCLGFSGTPNDLLPKAMGKCIYATKDDGKMIMALSSTDIVSVHMLGTWNAGSLLDIVAKARSPGGRTPKYHALIDSGALITGMTNLEVAEYLLRHGLDGFEGVVFLNEVDERMVLERHGFRVIRFAQCGLRADQRFTFYDHVHTTGMDVKQPLACVACLTLSKDMTFRDYAQGSYRMRGIGQGQRIEVLLTPEVMGLMHKSLGRLEKISEEARIAKFADLQKKPQAWAQQVIIDIILWLLINGILSEEKKHTLLCQQNLRNIWRQAACGWLGKAPADVRPWLEQEPTRTALSELCDQIDFSVPAQLPGEGEEVLAQKLQHDLSAHLREAPGSGKSVWQDTSTQESAKILAQAIISELGAAPLHLLGCDQAEGDLELSAEQVREQEHEREQEQEQEQDEEQEQLVELEEEQDKEVEAATERTYARDSEAAKPWELRSLLTPPGSAEQPFYPLAEFAINKGIMGQSCNPLKGLPEFVMVSDNHYRRTWRLSSVRRLKNVMCFLEWVPVADQLKRLKFTGSLSPDQRARLKEAFDMYDKDRSGSIHAQELRMLFRALDLDIEGEAAIASFQDKRLSLEQIEKEISSQSFCKMQKGRFYVILSLEEAEHLRASMHSLTASNWPAACGFALRCVANKDTCLNDSLIDAHGPVLNTAELGYQLEVAEQLLRFANSAVDFQARELNILLRSLQFTNVQDRLYWWYDVRSCRRRGQKPWQQLPVAKVFVNADEFDDLPTKALLSQMRWALATKRLWPVDAFRLLDTTSSGGLQKAEFIAGLDWLGLHRPGVSPEQWAQQADSLFRFVDKDDNAMIDLEEFRVAMELDSFDWESMATIAARNPDQHPSALVKQGTSEKQSKASAKIVEKEHALEKLAGIRLAPDMCKKVTRGRFKLKWKKHTAFQAVWSTPGNIAEKPLSLWAPINLVPKGRFGGLKKGSNAVKERVVFGHFACNLLGAPNGVSLLEVTDDKMNGMFTKHRRDALRKFMELFCPHPVRFRKVWAQTDSKPVQIWEPIPPASEYVALGMIATTEDIEPQLHEARCIPRLWVDKMQDQIVRMWSCPTSGGSTACFWSEGNSNVLFSVAVGTASQAPPEMYTMSSEKFYVDFLPA